MSATSAVNAASNGKNDDNNPTLPSGNLADLPPNQIAAILQNLPDIFKNLAEGEAAATLSNLSQTQTSFPGHISATHGAYPPPIHAQLPPGMEPGPSSHPHGPPNMGPSGSSGGMQAGQSDDGDDGGDGGDDSTGITGHGGSSGNRRGARSATMTNDEWTRQRKDNHKEVERRRRGNINDGINELGRIVPNGTGEKAKGAILQRAVQYILHLKENEARNIEKWTLEKLLMDQAMGDLQAQLEEVRRMWEDERTARLRAENELEVLRGVTGQAAPGQMAGTPQSAGTANVSVKEGSAGPQPQPNGASDSPNDNKRRVREDGDDGDSEDSAKRARVE